MMQDILILGTNHSAAVVAEVVCETPGFRLVGFVENWYREKCAAPIEGFPVFWVDDIAGMAGTCKVICGLGTAKRRAYVEQIKALGFEFATVVHPSARVPASAQLAEGCFLEPGVILSTHAELGAHVRIARGTTVGHHTVIGEYCAFMPGVNIAGFCNFADSVYVGIGATVIDHIQVGRLCIIGAGTVVLENLPERVMAVGVPARIIKTDIDGK